MSEEKKRICSSCSIEDTIDKFRPNQNLCKKCHNERVKENLLKKKKYIEENKDNTKLCVECNEEKKLELFSARSLTKCKDCINKKTRVSNVISTLDDKLCNKCNQNKPITRFRPNRNICKDCVNNRQREIFKDYYKDNKKNLKLKEKERNEKKIENMDEKTLKCCKVCLKDKSIIDFRLNRNTCKDCERDINKNFSKEKKLKCPIYKLICLTRVRIIQTLKKENKTKNTIEYLGTTSEIFKSWIEFNFEENMNFENHGKYWHVDHVIPVSKFNINKEEDVLKCFNWINLSPLTKIDNLTKSNNIEKEQILTHIKKLKEFNSLNNNIFNREIEEYEILCYKYL